MKYQLGRSFYIHTREAKDETQKCHPERIKTGPSNIIGRSDAESKKRAAPRAHTRTQNRAQGKTQSYHGWRDWLSDGHLFSYVHWHSIARVHLFAIYAAVCFGIMALGWKTT
jgi:hypothetical protein